MNKLKLRYQVNLKNSIEGGQLFNWIYQNKSSYLLFFDTWLLHIKQIKPTEFLWQTYPSKDDIVKVENFLNLSILDDLETLKIDNYMSKIIDKTGTLLLFKQGIVQTTLSFILSARQNISNIRQQILNLSNMYGDELNVDSTKIKLFPTIKKLASLEEKVYKELKFGYRYKYFSQSAKLIESSPNLTYETILNLPGVGYKIRDCISVFAMGNYDKVPIDIWAQRAVVNLFGAEDNQDYSYYQNFYQQLFPTNTAYAAQYVFEFYRNFRNK
jgi:N-glycosylase/DNA lyase